ncbi:transmembrane protein 72 isoform X1 [Gopherus flavomarginatus]|uniref:transmembrane protein 72 isoform X1 n=1 Tax=Gopherus flavomarginatus TaxID=286002 RepID=UPI0021CC2192|nr:transmembrane protein 72 isoform X1 [Gopherus flavomarginatus]
MKHRAFWTALEYTCRLLGVSTAAVLVGVGVETLQCGQFQSLAVYLLFSGAAVSICEVSFFVSLLLGTCITYQPGSLAHAFWKRSTQPASFQKFLGYVLLSVACFLHPVLVWHVTIPGSMLVLTGLAYFLLSKRKKSLVHGEVRGPLEQYVDPCATAATSMGCGDTEQTFTFPGGHREQHVSLLGHMKSILKGSKDKGAGWPAEPTPSPPTTTPPALAPGKQVHFQEKLVRIIPSVSESPDEAESEAEETTSDTAPILGPTETPLLVTPLSATGLF